jgi:transposase-like protein
MACPHCPYCNSSQESSGSRTLVVRFGSFLRKSDLSLQQRFFCKPCKRSFSKATFSPCFKQKKRHLNPEVFKFLASGLSQRRLAILFRVNRKTIVRKFIFMGLWSEHFLSQDLENYPKVDSFEFDDLETFDHTKLKPLSVIMAVESKTRRILGFKVAQMPAKGLLTQKSLLKYGKRKDQRKKARNELFQEIKEFVSPDAIIRSDENPHYPNDVKKHFPKCQHITFKGRRGCVTGQGELKSGGFDPLFTLNHTFAMYRANINRLFRKTWNTTKRPERLRLHIAIYVLFHNWILIQKKASQSKACQAIAI